MKPNPKPNNREIKQKRRARLRWGGPNKRQKQGKHKTETMRFPDGSQKLQGLRFCPRENMWHHHMLIGPKEPNPSLSLCCWSFLSGHKEFPKPFTTHRCLVFRDESINHTFRNWAKHKKLPKNTFCAQLENTLKKFENWFLVRSS